MYIYTFCNLHEFSLSPLGSGTDRVEPRLDLLNFKPAKTAKSCFSFAITAFSAVKLDAVPSSDL
jgi:hypothetical protein